MNNKRVLVLTGTTNIIRDPNSTDSTMEEVFDLTLPSKQRYAKKHGYDLFALRSFGVDKHNRFDHLKIGFMRALRSFEMLEYYDAVMWIDADAIITNDNMSIYDFQLDDQHSLYTSYDWTGKHSFSTGNFILHNTPHTNNLFLEFLNIGKQVVDGNHWGEEQTTLNHIYKASELKNTIKLLDHNYLNAVPAAVMQSEFWVNRQPVRWPWNENSFLAHLTGVSNKHRIEILENHFDRYI